MTRRSKILLVADVLFLLVNVAGAVAAVAGGELLHAGAHVALLLPAAYLAWRLAPRRFAGLGWRGEGSVDTAPPGELADRLTQLEQSLDAVAVEIERVGEGQRFMTSRLVDDGIMRPAGEGAAEPVEVRASKGDAAGPS